jgi:hypothetical protein
VHHLDHVAIRGFVGYYNCDIVLVELLATCQHVHDGNIHFVFCTLIFPILIVRMTSTFLSGRQDLGIVLEELIPENGDRIR